MSTYSLTRPETWYSSSADDRQVGTMMDYRMLPTNNGPEMGYDKNKYCIRRGSHLTGIHIKPLNTNWNKQNTSSSYFLLTQTVGIHIQSLRYTLLLFNTYHPKCVSGAILFTSIAPLTSNLILR